MTEKQIIKFIPSESSLVENKRKQCTVLGCTSTFINLSNLHMHLQKHHRIPVNKIVDNNTDVHYFCPISKCKYNVLESSGSNYFKTKKYLRQHFLKVHAEKSIKCSKCIKAFANQTLKIQHERTCGQIFQCIDCDWKYTSRECLLTHCRRKGHTVPPKSKELVTKIEPTVITQADDIVMDKTILSRIAPKNEISNDHTSALMKKVQLVLKSTPAAKIKANFHRAIQKNQTVEESKIAQTPQQTDTVPTKFIDHLKAKPNDKYKSLDLIDEESNSSTENSNEASRNLNNLSYVEDDSSLHYFTVSNFNAGLCHIETQTDLMAFDESNINSSDMDPLLCHMHTQTSDEILTELGLSDIQTQTNWPNDECNDLFVSTETQTCFDARLTMDNTSTQTQSFLVANCDPVHRANVVHEWSDDIRRQSQCTQTQFE